MPNLELQSKEKGSAVIGFAMVAPILMFISLAVLQLIYVLITYSFLVQHVDKSARLINMGYTNQETIFLAQNEINKSKFLGEKKSEILITEFRISTKTIKCLTIEIPISLPFGQGFILKASSYAS